MSDGLYTFRNPAEITKRGEGVVSQIEWNREQDSIAALRCPVCEDIVSLKYAAETVCSCDGEEHEMELIDVFDCIQCGEYVKWNEYLDHLLEEMSI